MKAAWLLAALLLGGCEGTMPDGHNHPKPPPIRPERCRPPAQKLVDLTHRLHEAMAYWPSGVAFKMTRLIDYDAGYRAHKLETGDGTGTHVDAPSHFVEGKRSLHEIPVEELMAPVVVIDVRPKTEHDADYVIGGNDIVDWEAIHGPVPVGSVVLFHTGWHEKFDDPAAYLNQDAEGVLHFPGLSKEAAQELVDRDVLGVGIDTLSIDPGTSKTFEAHHVVLGANKYQIENLDNLDALPEVGATIIIAVLPVLDGTQAQARVMALVPEEEPEEEEEEQE